MEPILEIETDLLPPGKIPTAPFDFPKAWSKSTISEEDYFFQFPKECVAELENLNIELKKNVLPALITRPEMYELENCEAFMKKIKDVLDNGVGFAVIDKLPIDSASEEVATTMHWLLGSLLGRPVAQNYKDGKMLYEVKDLTEGKGNNFSIRFWLCPLTIVVSTPVIFVPRKYVGWGVDIWLNAYCCHSPCWL